MALHPIRHALMVIGLISSAACAGPGIRAFDVEPQILCEGDKAIMHWNAGGELALTMQLEPLQQDDAECAPQGRDIFALTLVATQNGAVAQKRIEVAQLRSSAAEPVALPAESIEGTEVVASGEKNVSLWGSRVEVMTVAACRRRSIEVQHSGKTARLAPDGTPSSALAGTPLGGAWELRSPLAPNELAQPALRPKALKILARVRCKPQHP